MQRYTDLLSSVLLWMNSRRRELGIMAILLMGTTGSLFAQNFLPGKVQGQGFGVFRACRPSLRTVSGCCEAAVSPMPTPTPPPLLDPGCGDRTKNGKISCTIDQPNVRQRETPYPVVQFAPWRYCVHSGRRMRADRWHGVHMKRLREFHRRRYRR